MYYKHTAESMLCNPVHTKIQIQFSPWLHIHAGYIQCTYMVHRTWTGTNWCVYQHRYCMYIYVLYMLFNTYNHMHDT